MLRRADAGACGRRALIAAASRAAPPALAGVDQVQAAPAPEARSCRCAATSGSRSRPFILVTDAEKARDKRLAERRRPGRVPPLPEEAAREEDEVRGHRDAAGRQAARPRTSTELARPRSSGPPSATQTSAEIIVSGSLEFKVEDRSGYKTEEYVSPIDGRDLLPPGLRRADRLPVRHRVPGPRRAHRREAPPGRVQGLPADRQRSATSSQGLFENLFSLENQILNTFVAARPRGRALHLHGLTHRRETA